MTGIPARTPASGSLSRHGKESEMSQLTEIPTIAQQSVDLFALWSAASAIPGVGSVYIHESLQPGAAEALRAWAGAHGFIVEEQVHITDYSTPYVTLHVMARGCSLAVLRYRDATAEEVEAEQERTRFATSTSPTTAKAGT